MFTGGSAASFTFGQSACHPHNYFAKPGACAGPGALTFVRPDVPTALCSAVYPQPVVCVSACQASGQAARKPVPAQVLQAEILKN